MYLLIRNVVKLFPVVDTLLTLASASPANCFICKKKQRERGTFNLLSVQDREQNEMIGVWFKEPHCAFIVIHVFVNGS